MTMGILLTSLTQVAGMSRHIFVTPGISSGDPAKIWIRLDRGLRANPWNETTLPDLRRTLPPSEKTVKIVGVALGAEDVREIVDSSRVSSSLTRRALTLPSKALTTDSLAADLDYIAEGLRDGDETLVRYLGDGEVLQAKVSDHITITPAAPTPDPVPAGGRDDDLQAHLRGATPAEAAPAPAKARRTRKAAASPVSSVNAEPKVRERLAVMLDPGLAQKYVHREIDGVRDWDLLDHARALRRHVLLMGPTGPGKTMCLLAYAAANGMPVAVVSGQTAAETSDILGEKLPNDAGVLEYVSTAALDVVENGGMLLLNEVNFFPPGIVASLYPLLDFQRALRLPRDSGRTLFAHPKLFICADMNPGYAGTKPLNPAFRNRFSLQIPWGYDPNVESHLGVVSAVAELARQLRVAAESLIINSPTPTNALLDYQEDARALGLPIANRLFASRYEADDQATVLTVLDQESGNLARDLDVEPLPRRGR